MKQLFSIVLLMPLFIVAQEGIKFEEGLTWNQVLQKAKKDNKFIFVDCYATWCAPCKAMDKNVYPNDTVGQFFNEQFVSVKIQMDTSKADNEFVKGWYADASLIKKKYKVGAFPTYLFFSPNGNLMHRDVGGYTVIQLMSVGADALNPNMQYYKLLEMYHRNELDTAYMKALAKIVARVEGDGGKDLSHKIANDYINRLSTDALFTIDNIWLMYAHTRSSKDRGFAIFKDHSKRISETATGRRFTETACKDFVLGIINKEEIKPFTTTKQGKPDWQRIKSNVKKYGSLGDEAFTRFQPGILFKSEIEPELQINPDWNRILPLIDKLKLGRNAEFIVGSTVVYYRNNYKTEGCKNMVAAATYYADSFPTFLDARTLNSWAWEIFKFSNDKDELNKALAWSKRSNELDTNLPELIDTYANLLYKLGRVKEAISWQEKAVQQLAISGRKFPAINEGLEKMKRGEPTWPVK